MRDDCKLSISCTTKIAYPYDDWLGSSRISPPKNVGVKVLKRKRKPKII